MQTLDLKEAQASTNSYVKLLRAKVPDGTQKMELYVKENNVNAIKYKVLGWFPFLYSSVEVKAETNVAKNDESLYEITTPWDVIEVQIKSDVADTHGNVSGILCKVL